LLSTVGLNSNKFYLTLGYPSNGDKNEWQKFRKVSRNLFEKPRTKYNEWLVENGFPPITQNRCIPDSPFLNLYGFPEELDYTDLRPLPDKWFRVDALMRKGEEEFKLPEKFSKNKDKLIYLSLGSMGSIDVKLMKRLVEVLAKSPHKFIVSKGPLHDKYELADNMWGERSVPQTKVLPLVDLVINHGGNNTVTETFSFGKPMIVMPLFADQFDNAQRIHEKGFGIRLDTYNFKEEELLTAIEKLLNDEVLKKRLAAASNRMLNSDSLVKASELIEKLVK
jgi:MGT family glycosyltransferase